MKYQVGVPGRVAVVRFADGDDVLGGLREIARRENFRAAAFHLVGGLKRGRFVVGPETEEMPPVPVWSELAESHEIVAFRTIFWQGDEPKVHCHGAFGKREQVRAGCLREGVEAFLVLEAVITELQGITAERAFDAASGMVLLKMADPAGDQ